MLSRLEFGSFLVYAPHGRSEYEQRCRAFIVKLKQDAVLPTVGLRASQYVARRLRQAMQSSELETLFAGAPFLVPVPRSSLLKPNSLWPSHQICKALVELGLGHRIHPVLRRVKPVPKSAIAAPENRPSVSTHYASFTVERHLESSDNLLLVDDVVTRGATLLAAASRLADAYPGTTIRALAITRVMPPGIIAMINPCRGLITRTGRGVHRSP